VPVVRVALVATVVAIACVPRLSRAQSAEAQTLFSDGEKLLAAGEIEKACAAFEASNRIEPGAGTLIRLGDCRAQNHQLASAWSAYKGAADRAKDPRKAARAKAQSDALEPTLSTFEIVVAQPVDGLAITRNGIAYDSSLWGRAVPVDGGDYLISATAPNHEAWHGHAHVAVDHDHVRLEVPALAESAAAITHDPQPGGDRSHVAPPPPLRYVHAHAGIAIALVGAGVAATAVGLGFGVAATNSRDDAYALCPDVHNCSNPTRANALIGTAHDRAITADVLFGVGAVAAIAGAIVFVTSKQEVPVDVALVPGGATFAWRGGF